jgi:tight adherence protein B
MMLLVSGVCAAAAVMLALPGVPGTQRLAVEPAPRSRSGANRFAARALIGAGLLPIVGTLFMLVGARAAVLASALLVIAGVCWRLAVLHAESRRALQSREQVAHACSVLAAQVRAGRVPGDALQLAAEDCPILADSGRVLRLGGDVVSVWRTAASKPGCSGLLQLSRSWQIAFQTGAPLASALEQVADTLRDDQEIRALVAAELAAPRATGKIMAVLPFCGLGLGYVIGGDPLEFLMGGPYGWACLFGGVTLAAAGVLWIDRLARDAVRVWE